MSRAWRLFTTLALALATVAGTHEGAEAGSPAYEVFARPLEHPDDGARTIEVDPALAGGPASPFGWHDTNGVAGPEYTSTRGNKARAYTDPRESVRSRAMKARAYPSASRWIRISPITVETRVRFTNPRAQTLRLSVHDPQGRLVDVLFEGVHGTGAESFLWNAGRDRGAALPPGVYFLRLEGSGEAIIRKVVLLEAR